MALKQVVCICVIWTGNVLRKKGFEKEILKADENLFWVLNKRLEQPHIYFIDNLKNKSVEFSTWYIVDKVSEEYVFDYMKDYKENIGKSKEY